LFDRIFRRRRRETGASAPWLPGVNAVAPSTSTSRSVATAVEVVLDAPRAVLTDEPFDVTVGTILPAGVTLPAGLHVLAVVDPQSFIAHGEFRHELTPLEIDVHLDDETGVTVQLPATFRLSAVEGEDLQPDRRLWLHYLHGGQPVGAHCRSIRVVSDREALSAALAAPAPPERPVQVLLDGLDRPRPDLVLAIRRADAEGVYVWSAFAPSISSDLPVAERSSQLGEATETFARDNRRTVERGNEDRYATYRWLVGRGIDIADAMPEAIRDVLFRLIEEPGRTTPATVLLLTEEMDVPWELAVVSTNHDPGARRRVLGPGGSSPFLGSHVAIGRWPLTDGGHLIPPSDVAVTRQAVVTAHYAGVEGWAELSEAEEEATELLRDYQPSDRVPPLHAKVLALLDGTPRAEVMHFALHGQFDPEGIDEGLVLLRPTGEGRCNTQYLQAAHVRSATLSARPFVFLNACQVGAAKQVLGDYGGLATTFLEAGASAVVAPLWDLDDHEARSVASQFYAAVFGAEHTPAAEVLRQVRAGYSESRFGHGQWPPGPTLLAYQFFGHPKFRMNRSVVDGANDGASTADIGGRRA
jgi:hypothetical protein